MKPIDRDFISGMLQDSDDIRVDEILCIRCRELCFGDDAKHGIHWQCAQAENIEYANMKD